ncbi:hypothetical protein BFW01_g582 [Lasiodiplodia theobromae]|nr:hypothetical protein BFW01_g582 [Lasiodiplodia theobromae]
MARQTSARMILEKIQQYWNGQQVNIAVAASIRLRRSEYHKLLNLLAQDEQIRDFAFRRLKLFYDRRRRKLSYEMPSLIHETMTANFVEEISAQLRLIDAKHSKVLQLRKFLKWTGRSEIKMPGDCSGEKKSPDAVWVFRAPKKMGECFLIEVCLSQTLQAASQKVRQTIYHNYGRPGMAIVVKHDYNTPKQLLNLPKGRSRAASYTAFGWVVEEKEDGSRHSFVERTVEQQEFRNRDGDVVPGKLSITIRDFIGKRYHKYVPNFNDPAVARALDEAITIDHSTMKEWLDEAEEIAIENDPDFGSNVDYNVNNEADDDEDSTDSDSDNENNCRSMKYDPQLDASNKASDESSSSSGNSDHSQQNYLMCFHKGHLFKQVYVVLARQRSNFTLNKVTGKAKELRLGRHCSNRVQPQTEVPA